MMNDTGLESSFIYQFLEEQVTYLPLKSKFPLQNRDTNFYVQNFIVTFVNMPKIVPG